VVNHRISVASSVEELQHHLIETLSPVAFQYNLSLEAFGKDVVIKGCPAHLTTAKAGKLILAEAFNSSLVHTPSFHQS
jgi:Gly-Xaa carboxypeptidase